MYNYYVHYQPLGPTQPPILGRMGNEYQPRQKQVRGTRQGSADLLATHTCRRYNRVYLSDTPNIYFHKSLLMVPISSSKCYSLKSFTGWKNGWKYIILYRTLVPPPNRGFLDLWLPCLSLSPALSGNAAWLGRQLYIRCCTSHASQPVLYPLTGSIASERRRTPQLCYCRNMTILFLNSSFCKFKKKIWKNLTVLVFSTTNWTCLACRLGTR